MFDVRSPQRSCQTIDALLAARSHVPLVLVLLAPSTLAAHPPSPPSILPFHLPLPPAPPPLVVPTHTQNIRFCPPGNNLSMDPPQTQGRAARGGEDHHSICSGLRLSPWIQRPSGGRTALYSAPAGQRKPGGGENCHRHVPLHGSDWDGTLLQRTSRHATLRARYHIIYLRQPINKH